MLPGGENHDEQDTLPPRCPTPLPPDAPAIRSPSQPSSLSRRVGAFLPFVVTSLVSILLTLLIQGVLPVGCFPARSPRQTVAQQLETPPAIMPLPVLPEPHAGAVGREPLRAIPTRPPNVLLLSDEEMSYEVLHLRSDLQQLWGAYYLTRAAMLLVDAETALRSNDQAESERLLMTAAVSLDLAYEWSAEQEKGPIHELRSQLAVLYEDLAIRPEHLDIRLRRLRQTMLTLMGKG